MFLLRRRAPDVTSRSLAYGPSVSLTWPTFPCRTRASGTSWVGCSSQKPTTTADTLKENTNIKHIFSSLHDFARLAPAEEPDHSPRCGPHRPFCAAFTHHRQPRRVREAVGCEAEVFDGAGELPQEQGQRRPRGRGLVQLGGN